MDVNTVLAITSIVAPFVVHTAKNIRTALLAAFVGVMAAFAWMSNEMALQSSATIVYTAMGFFLLNIIMLVAVTFVPLLEGRED